MESATAARYVNRIWVIRPNMAIAPLTGVGSLKWSLAPYMGFTGVVALFICGVSHEFPTLTIWSCCVLSLPPVGDGSEAALSGLLER